MFPQTDVIIPAKNEDKTIGDIVETLEADPRIGQIIVCCDSCDDGTEVTALLHGASMVLADKYGGKGQAVMAGLEHVRTDKVMFCDADYVGVTEDHVSALLCDCPGIVVGIPDIPPEYPDHRLWAWPWCSGLRIVPTVLTLPLELHGYLMETQLNLAARNVQMAVRFKWLHGLKAPWNMSETRLAAMQADYEWGKEHGIL
jgi:glycosyltransferase involved in cell wall biosynthesis